MKINFKSKKLWIIAGIVLAVIAIAIAATVIIVNLTSDDIDADAAATKIFWNIDRQVYYGQGQGGTSGRELSTDDGYYHVLFSVDGRPTERKVRSYSVVNKIDNNDAMGLVIDERTRDITDIVPLEEISGGFLFKRMYVSEVKGTEITVNSSSTFMGDEKKVKVKTTTPIIDVSLQATTDAGMPVKLETIEKKDQISVILNKDGSIFAVYIVKRSKITPVYWNLERKYNSKFKETTREQDADGVYHFKMAVRGQQVDVKVKDRQLANKIDSVGSRCCGLNFDDDGYAIEYIAPTKCTGGKSVASWADVMSMDGLEFMAEKHSITAYDNGKQFNLTLDPDCEIYNVSNNFEKFAGEVTDLKVSDRVQGFTDPTGKVVLLFIVQRWKTGDIYWNAYRMWDSTKLASTRQRQADGYFHFMMVKNGQLVDVKVADASVANLMDKAGSRTMGLRFSGDVAVEYIGAGKFYASQASWYDVEKFVDSNRIHVKKNSPSAKDYGKEYDVQLADYCKIYNATETYNDHIGEETTLRVGDRIQAWVDHTGKAKYIFIVSRKFTNPVTAHNYYHTCGDCGANVNWIPWTSGSTLPTTSGHYYLCGDVYPTQASIKANQNVVLCLNGHKVRAAGKRIYALYEQGASLTIHDCVGTGKMYSTYAGDLGTTQGAIFWVRYGSLKVFGTNNGSSTTTFSAPTGKANNVGPVIATNSNVNITIKNAVINGGKTTKNGGAIYMAAGSKTILSLENVTVNSGVADTGKGNGIYMKSNSQLYLAGKINISGGAKSDLYLESGANVYFDTANPIDTNSRIVVESGTAGGRITNNYVDGAENCFVSSDSKYTVSKGAGYVFLSQNTSTTEHKITHTCEHCGEEVIWLPWVSVNSLPTTSGHYYLCSNVEAPQQNVSANQDVVLCLNGFTVKGTSNRVYAVNGENAKLTICDCTDKGKIYNGKNGSLGNTTQGGVFWVRMGVLNLFGGTYEANQKYLLPSDGALICEDGASTTKGNAINIKNAKLIGGFTNGNGGVMSIKTAATSLENVTIENGIADKNGDAIYMAANTTLNLAGKISISGGDDSQVYLASGAYITFNSPLSSGSHIGITTEDKSGKLSTNYYDGVEKYFASQKDGYKVARIGNMLYLINNDQVIEDHKNSHTCEECGESVEWIAWGDSSSLPTTTGHYYLATDVEAAQHTINTENANVVLCLNGHTIKGTTNRVYALNATGAKLTICDCENSGKVYNGSATITGTTQGSVFWVRKGTLNIFGGTYEAAKSTVPGHGAAICDDGTGNTINIKNAKIIGGTTAKSGGAIFVNTNAKLSLTDVEIVAGTATDKGDAISLGKNATLTVSGKVNITGGNSQVFLGDGALIKIADGLAEGSHIGVDTDKTAKITSNYIDGAEAYFENSDENATLNVQNKAIWLLKPHAHKCDECGEDVEWTAWSDAASLPTTTGHYYLTTDVEAGQHTINTENANVVLCLNGHTIKGTTNRVYALNATGAKLTICDCENTGKVYNGKATITGTTQGSVIWVRKGTLNIFGGTYEAAKSKVPGHGAAICDDGTGNTINIKNAKIIGGTTAKSGGAIFVNTNAKLSLTDVEITAGTATVNGDAIYMGKNATLTVSGKVNITGGKSQVFLGDGALIKIADGLAEGSHIGVNTDKTDGKITSNYIDGAEKYFESQKTGFVISQNGEYIFFGSALNNSPSANLNVFSNTYSLLGKAGTK